MIAEYKIVTGTDIETTVNNLLARGWEVNGAPFISPNGDIIQNMTRERDKVGSMLRDIRDRIDLIDDILSFERDQDGIYKLLKDKARLVARCKMLWEEV
jgi:hypothetical protein